MRNIVILISGGGSNMAAIVQAAESEDWAGRYGARVAAVLSNRPDAAGLGWARAHGLAAHAIDHKAYADRADFDAALAGQVAQYDQPDQPALLVLAGFMRVLGVDFVARHAGRMLNIHPSLLPAFAGLHTHARALQAGCRFAGATVHWVTAELDHGPIVDQAVVPILPADTSETLAQRVLAQEHQLYPRALRQVLSKLKQRSG